MCFNLSMQHVEKARGNAKFYCDRLGAYRMPFAWTAVQLLSVISDANNMEKEGEGGQYKVIGTITSL